MSNRVAVRPKRVNLVLKSGVRSKRTVQTDSGTKNCIYYGVMQGNVHRTTSHSQEQAVLNLRRYFREDYKVEGPLEAFFVLTDSKELVSLSEDCE